MGGLWVQSRRCGGAISVVLQAAQDRVGVGLPKWGLGYVSLGRLDVDWSSWWCAISLALGCDEPMLGCEEPVLVCNLSGALGGASLSMLVCDLSSLLFLSLFCFPGAELI